MEWRVNAWNLVVSLLLLGNVLLDVPYGSFYELLY
jgi:hypothetical protein